jgi:protein subunit release factor A
MKEMHLTKKDFRVDWFSGTGAGGQYRNKHQNCCRITHVATGLVATGQSNRDRPSNQREAFRSLAGKIIALEGCGPDPRRYMENVVRTYHFERSVATDGELSIHVAKAMDGHIDEFIERALLGERSLRSTGRV